ncbi:MAG: UDP-4-amino-4,6-dideoxy-N-acetyl-beta-L-altrosamine transaminase [Cytophagia bacterium]|nr:UDP-4-amino-4,6-dideoxy-N-acetyl-beta-L-altrosamine transaminase [Cytophagia bacterium]NBW34976.1 UDP-4-amino-4,6-dideoxy-N-acetyl-beta-L-altrosamine transaminase [Cytophagia bacterium]
MKAIPYGRQNITQQDIDAVVEALTSDFLTQGPKILEFEEKFAKYVNAKYAVALANGTAALHLSALALGVDTNTKVITTPITFAASANCIRYCGGELVFADIDPQTALIDINSVRSILEASPKGTYQGIIPVDFAGYPVDLEKFRKLADEFGLWILEDACHAPGGSFVDSKGKIQSCGNGSFADLAIFSFHPVKHIACGEGGMITTNDKALYEKLLTLRTHGITKDPARMNENHGGWYYEMVELGYNYRLTDMQAALGISQLTRADEGLLRRKQLAHAYDKAFSNTAVKTIVPESGFSHAYHLYVIQVSKRKELYDALKERGIYAQIHYVPVHTMPYYQSLGYKKGSLPKAENYYSQCISLPMYPTLTDEEQAFVINTVLNFVTKN